MRLGNYLIGKMPKKLNSKEIIMGTELALQETMTIGQIMADSHFFNDAKQQAQAIVKILAGQEMGIGAVAAMTGIHVIQGRVQVGANLMANAVKSHPKYDYRVRVMEDNEVVLEFFEAGESLGFSRFTTEDARRAGTKNMDKFPRNMLFSRAISNGIKWYCPDALNGNTAYVPGELEEPDTSEQKSHWIVEQPTPPAPVEKVTPATPENIAKWLYKLNALQEVNGYFKHPQHLQNALKIEAFPATFHNGDGEKWKEIKAAAIAYADRKHFEAQVRMMASNEDEVQAFLEMYEEYPDTAWDAITPENENNGSDEN